MPITGPSPAASTPAASFDREVTLDQTPQGCQDMDTRRILKVLIRP